MAAPAIVTADAMPVGRAPLPELRALTGLRGIAAWWVVFYHARLSIGGLPDAARAVLSKGYLAVDFFFLLSGFVIWLAWHDRLAAGDARARRVFWAKRVARIWPLHAVMLSGAVLMALALAATGRTDPVAFPWADLPIHILLLQDWGFGDPLAWNNPAWSISAEAAAYLLFPFALRLIDWRRLPTLAIMGGLGSLLVLLHLIYRHGDADLLGNDIQHFGLVRCLLQFAAGSAVAALWLRYRDRPTLSVWPTIAGVGLLALWAVGADETAVIPAAFACLLLAAALTSDRPRNPLSSRPVHYLGDISYATYLSHFLLFFAFKFAFMPPSHLLSPGLVALYAAMVFASSVALYHLIERPAQAWLNARWAGKIAARRAAPGWTRPGEPAR